MKRSDCYDVLIVGAGPAGMAAACSAANNSRHVGLIDDNPLPGGQIWRGGKEKLETREGRVWFDKLARANLEIRTGIQVAAHSEPGVLWGETEQGPCELAYDKLIIAAGARERFLPFPGWTLPNVMGAGGLPALIKSGYPIKGKKVAIAGSGPLLLATGAHLRSHGADVKLIAEQAPWTRLIRFGLALPFLSPSKVMQGACYKCKLFCVRYLTNCWPVAAHGEAKLSRVTFRAGDDTWEEECDLLACGFGFVPNLELPMLLGCQIKNGVVRVNQWQETSIGGVYCAGEPTGIGGVDLALIEGQIAGYAAVGEFDNATRLFTARKKGQRFARAMDHAFALREELKNLATGDTIVCRCEDVTRARIEKYDSSRAAKLQTRCGMGTCQGRICGGATEFLFGFKPEAVRPPIFPITLKNLPPKGKS
ncbi:MAG: FAD/NAD(P)-binding oxidoreductase [Thermoguttaceae bacterium]|jgi:NADPH-dependent 2,4-dienoyl-CoA reductase/sulfur reductase-like enzyme